MSTPSPSAHQPDARRSEPPATVEQPAAEQPPADGRHQRHRERGDRHLAAVGEPSSPGRAAERVERFLAVRDRMTSLDPEEVTGVFTGGGLLILQRSDLEALCRFARERQAPDSPGR